MAAVWQGVVCGVHDADHWELAEGGHSCVPYVRWSGTRLTGVGFVAYDQYNAMLQDADGKISRPRTVIAGFGAGVTESLFAVTPFESIKTTLYFRAPSPRCVRD